MIQTEVIYANYGGLSHPILDHMMSFKEFLEANPQLIELSRDEQLNEYDRYLSASAETMDDWVMG